ncbi:cysteine desulfurase [Streptomyces clavuligerus]|uniref:cysteine desulfurase n=1 Tax=Streptomyces clavuligerus TaxID=1901 RepID=UPI00017FF9FB|nr:cysteine desulfurase [Streptomyces clavuligerus]EDY50439.1 cysteine desulfurase [Streptomyces clavuligerus]QCS09556.1 cysteine desulfurase [Streptomyces clavuligerus]QPJ98391.1 SufS family cysteine desulfurase [Streptomyces clavuligerus]WDN56280.1 cysteine desulfurase [Streptomyces clavuligerus]
MIFADSAPAPVPVAGTGRYWLRPADARSRWSPPRRPPVTAERSAPGFSPEAVRADFPILAHQAGGERLIWLDNAATTQKSRQVIDAISGFYTSRNSNVHRGAHPLAIAATEEYEEARAAVARFLGTADPAGIVFVRGATEAINLVAHSWGRSALGPGDEIVLTALEHHSNIVPWQVLAQERGAVLRVVPLDARGDLDQAAYRRLLGPRTRLVALTQVSNVLGTVVPVAGMADEAHRHGALTLVDGAQAVGRFPVDVQRLGADFYVLSGHKMFGPTGIGALYARPGLLDTMAPWQTGGGMIETVSFENSTYAPVPQRFEAGTGPIAEAVGLRAAIGHLHSLDRHAAAVHEEELTRHLAERLAALPGVRVVGNPRRRVGAVPFLLDGVPPDAVATALGRRGIAVRSGHHCAQPALRHFGLDSVVRPSLALYNTHADIDSLALAVGALGRSGAPPLAPPVTADSPAPGRSTPHPLPEEFV